jgi:hypothetical protein
MKATTSQKATDESKVPKNWREVKSAVGELLYAERLCCRYWVRFECGEWCSYYDAAARGFGHGNRIGKAAGLTHALVACRDHMYEKGLDYFVPTAAKTRPNLL